MKRQTYKGFVIDTDQFGRVYILDTTFSDGGNPVKKIVSYDCKHCHLTDVKKRIDYERLSSGLRSDRVPSRRDIVSAPLIHYIADTFECPRDSDCAIHINASCVDEALKIFQKRFEDYTLIDFVVVESF